MFEGGLISQIVRLVPLLYLISFMGFFVFSWNFQGYGNTKFPQIFNEYNREFKHDIVSLFETRVSGGKVDKIIANLGFQYSHRVEAIGLFSGVWVGWKDSVSVEVIRS